MGRILLVEDDESFAESLTGMLAALGHSATHEKSIDGARSALSETRFDSILLDLMLPDGNGLELLDARGDQHVIIMTGDPGIRDSIRWLTGRGLSFLTKPFSLSELKPLLETDKSEEQTVLAELIGASPPIVQLRKEISRVAARSVPVFITGESGVGKELVAEAIHRLSGRDGEFVAVNCGAISPDLLPSQLFGHEKGSFTGAQKRHVGYFEQASGGTLFLDEIIEMPLDQQPSLLRALESDRVTRVGGSGEIEVDVRIVAAANRDPKEAVSAGKLREDLFFRLAVFPIEVPPLRNRGSDVQLLACHFLDDLNATYGTDLSLPDDALDALHHHTWPGNVRELKHVIQRAYILADPEDEALQIEPRHLTPFAAPATGDVPVGLSIQDMEKNLILKTLEAYDGDKPTAAKVLGISLRTLYNRLNDYAENEGDTID